MGSLLQQLEKSSPAFTITFSLVLVAVIGVVDYVSGYAIFFSAFYLLPVAIVSWYVNARWGVLISTISVTVWLVGDFAAGARYPNLLVPIWNGAIALTVYFVVVKALVSLRKLQRELEERVRQRTRALASEMEERSRLEKELLEISERSQREIGHDLHDGLGQHLTATAFATQVLTERLENQSLPESAAGRNLVKMVEDAINLTRTFARGLQPVEMDADGLTDGFSELARSISERFKVSCEFECREPVQLQDAACSTHLYRIAQEAITNAVKHGKARFINLSLEKNPEAVTLTITDDGTGLPENARAGAGMGLRIMAYRAAMIGAHFNIERLPDSGTRVTCRLPVGATNQSETHAS